MWNQLSVLPDFSSTCSHRPTAVGSLAAGAAEAAFSVSVKPIVSAERNFMRSLTTRAALIAFLWRESVVISRRDLPPDRNEKPPEPRSGGSKRQAEALRSRIAAAADSH